MVLAERMPERWRVPEAPVVLDFADGLSAVRLKAAPGEVEAPVLDNHILSFVNRGDRHHRLWRDGRLVMDGPLPDRSLNIVCAGLKPRALFAEAVDITHVYMPHAYLIAQAEAAGASRAQSLEVIDPFCRADPVLLQSLELLQDTLAHRDWASRLWLDALGAATIARVLGRWSNLAVEDDFGRSYGTSSRDWRVRRTLAHLEAHLADDVGLAELAAEVGLTERHYTRLFQAATGLPPHRWLTKRRVERACDMLLDQHRSITEIALELGFASSQHFATVFRKHMGATPREYRRERLL